MSSDRFRINIAEDGKIYKVTSIYLLSDGSFKLDVPYAGHQKGLIRKIPFPGQVYKRMSTQVKKSRLTQEYDVSNRPQLSVHASGLVQFSGKGIRSGIDKDTGEQKGIAIQTQPLTDPIGTGPTCGILAWGISNGYEELTKVEPFDLVYPSSVFTPRHFGERDQPNTYQLEIWVFPNDEYYSQTLRRDMYGNEWMALRFPNYLHDPNAAFIMRVIRLKGINSFLAILPSKVETGFANQASFGFHLGGPSERSKTSRNEYVTIDAISPAGPDDAEDRDLPTLDYE